MLSFFGAHDRESFGKRMDTLQNAPTSNKLINYRPIAEIAVGLMLGIVHTIREII